MSFTFDFYSADDATADSSTAFQAAASEEAKCQPLGSASVRARILSASEAASEAESFAHEKVEVPLGPPLLKCIVPEQRLPELLRSEVSGETELFAVSDLVAGQYEGGFKLWECARDLLDVMSSLHDSGKINMRNARVLEAGCGAGLPGIFSLRYGCESLVLQDFNAEVLCWMTMPCLKLNGAWDEAERGRVSFCSGDWAEVGPLLDTLPRSSSTPGFDLILTSDSIYSPPAACHLWALIKGQLRSPHGAALVAAKSYYFGVGGSVADFRAVVGADGDFECETVQIFEDGRSNRREVLLVRRGYQTNAQPAMDT
uniref:protein-histidine N-methyltransferase n=1 Tax=Chrysotila carterae TaxID=13221 RepID=A0A7S4FCT4_CHRCT|mmetsp:Transcript_57602/g.125131  ORF Transcript_57602/g.125131 Transcript_57602/m.125131 type:complete len:314 (+) Transcript_57602:113-1054(+)